MLEQTRLNYLQAMGVAQWMPRHALPFAPEPRWLATDANQNPQLAANTQTDEDTGYMPELGDLLGEQKTVEQPQGDSVVKSAIPVSNEPVSAAVIATAVAPNLDPTRNVTPHFQLFFISSSLPVVWVCDNVEEVEMLQRLIHSIQKGMQGHTAFVAQAYEFRWPYLQTHQQDQSLPVALQALQAQWSFMQERNKAQGVVAIGQASQQWLQQIQVKQVCTAPSVFELQQSAALKRQLWQSLLPLL